MLTRSVTVLFAISLAAVACTQSSPGVTPAGPNGDKIVLTGDQKADWAQIVAIEDQAKAFLGRRAGRLAAEESLNELEH